MIRSPERAYPCLLDRILGTGEGAQARMRGWDLEEYRKCVLRDLKWLLNSWQPLHPARCETRAPIEEASVHDSDPRLRTEANRGGYLYPLARRSVLNYGAPSLAGAITAGLDGLELERELREVIQHFEPRFVRESVSVSLVRGQLEAGKIAFVIEARLWALPRYEALKVRTEYDLESGGCVLQTDL